MRRSAIGFLALMLLASAVAQNKPDPPGTSEFDVYEYSGSQNARLGVTVNGLNDELRAFFGAPRDSGLLVAHVAPDGPAAHAGIRVGDIITSIGGHSVSSVVDLVSGVTKREPRLAIQ